eukprot:TRINITY_DN74603_c0_g1_i1.p1 TRINITY_DN74603_c0_g1~~TRINITY_DN74603_c0_g1_i1.p1  ORF type:complete len:335 (+),score=52.33 TRINITY_DN74603_c0_g1_i1:74-1006(+)
MTHCEHFRRVGRGLSLDSHDVQALGLHCEDKRDGVGCQVSDSAGALEPVVRPVKDVDCSRSTRRRRMGEQVERDTPVEPAASFCMSTPKTYVSRHFIGSPTADGILNAFLDFDEEDVDDGPPLDVDFDSVSAAVLRGSNRVDGVVGSSRFNPSCDATKGDFDVSDPASPSVGSTAATSAILSEAGSNRQGSDCESSCDTPAAPKHTAGGCQRMLCEDQMHMEQVTPQRPFAVGSPPAVVEEYEDDFEEESGDEDEVADDAGGLASELRTLGASPKGGLCGAERFEAKLVAADLGRQHVNAGTSSIGVASA